VRSGTFSPRDTHYLFDELLCQGTSVPVCPQNGFLAVLARALASDACSDGPPLAIDLFCHMNRGADLQVFLPTPYTYDIFMGCCCRACSLDLMLAAFGRFLMIDMGTNDVIAFSSLLRGLCDVKRKEEAKDELLYRMSKLGCVLDVFSCTIVLKGLCGNGRSLRALEILWTEGTGGACLQNVVAYNTLICSFFKEGEAAKACDLFHEMVQQGIPPSVATYSTKLHTKFDELAANFIVDDADLYDPDQFLWNNEHPEVSGVGFVHADTEVWNVESSCYEIQEYEWSSHGLDSAEFAVDTSIATAASMDGVEATQFVIRILDISKDYHSSSDQIRRISGLLLAKLLARPDMAKPFSSFMEWVLYEAVSAPGNVCSIVRKSDQNLPAKAATTSVLPSKLEETWCAIAWLMGTPIFQERLTWDQLGVMTSRSMVVEAREDGSVDEEVSEDGSNGNAQRLGDKPPFKEGGMSVPMGCLGLAYGPSGPWTGLLTGLAGDKRQSRQGGRTEQLLKTASGLSSFPILLPLSKLGCCSSLISQFSFQFL
jgi:pentatricopeptide repeat protein